MSRTTQGYTVIQKSASKLLRNVAIAATGVPLGMWLIQGGAVDTRGQVSVFLGWIGTPIFGLCLLLGLHRLIFGHIEQVELSPQGFWDKRFFKQEVPWNAVSRISIWSLGGASSLRIQLTRESMRQIKPSPIGRVTSWLNNPFCRDGVSVSSADLRISFSELCALFGEYLSDYNPGAINDIK